MRIAYIASGAAGMYCGTCLHDNTLAAALMARGHEVALIPTYTPIRTDEENVSLERVFFGALNVYLQDKYAFFRRPHRWLDRLLDRPGLLEWVSKRAVSAEPGDLGALTLSVLRGRDGKVAREVERLLAWLAEYRPDLVHLNQVMFAGFAAAVKTELGVPVVSGLTGEDLFLEQLREPWKGRVLAELRVRAAEVDAFLAPSADYAELMAEYLEVPPERIRKVPLGLHLSDVTPRSEGGSEPFVVGYLARICPEKGLHLLLEAFRDLAGRVGPERLRLRVAGYLGRRDLPYWRRQSRRVERWGLGGRVEFVGEVDRAGKLAFLRSLDALSVPAVYREPKGLYVLEALAHGVPVVQPRIGSFPELVAATGGGLLVEPGSPEALAEGLRELLEDPARRGELGRRGREAVRLRFGEDTMAAATEAVYQELLGAQPRQGGAHLPS